MNSFKFLKENSTFTPNLATTNIVLGGVMVGHGLTNSIIIGEDAVINQVLHEFVFQFDDDEPVPFTQGSLSVTLSARAGSSIGFADNGKSFKIYSRQI